MKDKFGKGSELKKERRKEEREGRVKEGGRKGKKEVGRRREG